MLALIRLSDAFYLVGPEPFLYFTYMPLGCKPRHIYKPIQNPSCMELYKPGALTWDFTELLHERVEDRLRKSVTIGLR